MKSFVNWLRGLSVARKYNEYRFVKVRTKFHRGTWYVTLEIQMYGDGTHLSVFASDSDLEKAVEQAFRRLAGYLVELNDRHKTVAQLKKWQNGHN